MMKQIYRIIIIINCFNFQQIDRSPSQEFTNYTDMELNFEIKQVGSLKVEWVDRGKGTLH